MIACAPRTAPWGLLALLLVISVATVSAQGCNSLVESYQLAGTAYFSNLTTGASCVRIIPQPSNKALAVREIYISLDDDYYIGTNDLVVYSTWFPLAQDRYTVYTFDSCCDTTEHNISSPVITIAFNATNLQFTSFNIKWVAKTSDTRTKFSMGFFQGLIVSLLLPILMLVISLCTFRRGICNADAKKRRLSRKTPKAEKIATFIACGVGMLFFFLLTFRVFG